MNGHRRSAADTTTALGHVAVTADGAGLAVTTTDVRRLRAALTAAGVTTPMRIRDGSLRIGFTEAHALLPITTALSWDPRALRMAENRERVRSDAPRVAEAVRAIFAAGAPAARRAIADCVMADVLDDHQVVNVAALTTPSSYGGCIFDEQGTGKTATMIAIFDVLVERRIAETLLVVAPKSMVAEWAEEFRKFTGDLYRVRVADGDRRQKAGALYAGADVVVVNYTTLVAIEDEVVRLAGRTRLVLAVDESFNVKNPDARRSAAARRVREWCSHAFVLCGTPAPNSARDLVAQFDLVDFGQTFGSLRLDSDPEVARVQIRDRLHEKGVYVRNLKADVLVELPRRTFTEVEVDLAPQQRVAYDAALLDLVVDLERIDDETYAREIQSFLQRRATLLRICADPEPVVPGYVELPAKITALDELLQHLVEDKGEKVVVWSFYRSSLERIARRYARYGLVRVDGSVNSTADRREAVRAFQEDDDVAVFLGNPAAAGAGLTLHGARYAVYESLSNQAAHYLQSLDRIHRRGQARDVRYVTLLARGTVEEAEYARLRTKADAQADLLGDPYDPPPSRRILLDELLLTQP